MSLTGSISSNQETINALGLIDRAGREADAQRVKQLFTIGLQLGKAVATLEMQKIALESGNRKLQEEIEQLKVLHSKEFNGIVESWKFKAKLLTEKLATVTKEIDGYSATAGTCGSKPIATEGLKVLTRQVEEVMKKTFFYPAKSGNPTTAVIESKESAVLPYRPPINLVDSSIRELVERHSEEIKTLSEEVKVLRGLNVVLADEKKGIIDFHNLHIEQQGNKVEETLGLGVAYEKAQSILGAISWTIPRTSRAGCTGCAVTRPDIISASKAELYHRASQDMRIKNISDLKSRVDSCMAPLKEYFSPKQCQESM